VHLSYTKTFTFILLILAIFSEQAFANNSIATKEKNKKKNISPNNKQGCEQSGSYCGIYCLYAVMKLFEIDIDPIELHKPEYIGSSSGSSLAELKKAAEDKGLYAIPVGQLTTRELRQSPYPVILHVRSDATKKNYNHYELFLETKDVQARLYNPPEPVRLVPFRELVPRWDGTGLVISDEPVDLVVIYAPARRRFIIYTSVIVALILIVRWSRRSFLSSTTIISRHILFGLSIAEGMGFVIAALLCGMLYNLVNDEGFLANPKATASVQQAYLGTFIPRINERQAVRLFNTDAVFIDTRFAHDFETGHLEGAINIPVDANDSERQKTMTNISKDAHIIVYCQSSNYKFAEKMAIKLISDGFADVSIFRDVWHDLNLISRK